MYQELTLERMVRNGIHVMMVVGLGESKDNSTMTCLGIFELISYIPYLV